MIALARRVTVLIYFYFPGMNEVGLHMFLGKCPSETVELIFPASEKRYITAQQVKDAVVFEESVGHEDTIMFFMNTSSSWRNMKQV